MVSGGMACRVVGALVPIAMLWVSKQILDSVQARFSGQPLPEHFWWLVGTEALLAAFAAILGRGSRLLRRPSGRPIYAACERARDGARVAADLASYEDPVFYDKLERARVQATDRIAMIQAIGALVQQIDHGDQSVAQHLLVFALALAAAGCRGGAGISRREPLRISRIFAEYPPDAGPPSARLPARARSEQGVGQGTEAFRTEQLHHRRVRATVQRLYTTRMSRSPGDACGSGALLSLVSTGGYYGAYAWIVYRTVTRRSELGNAAVPGRSDRRRQQQHPVDLLDVLHHRRPVAVPDGSG